MGYQLNMYNVVQSIAYAFCGFNAVLAKFLDFMFFSFFCIYCPLRSLTYSD